MKKFYSFIIFIFTSFAFLQSMQFHKNEKLKKELKNKIQLPNGYMIPKNKPTEIFHNLNHLSVSVKGGRELILLLIAKCHNMSSKRLDFDENFFKKRGLDPNNEDVRNFMLSFAITKPKVFGIDWEKFMIVYSKNSLQTAIGDLKKKLTLTIMDLVSSGATKKMLEDVEVDIDKILSSVE